MIKHMLDNYAAQSEKTWEHNRANTVGGSEIFGCQRKAYFSKNDIARDADYVDGYGARKRGDLIENHWVVPAVRANLPTDACLLFAGEDQRTIVDGYLSATPDGVLANMPRDCLAYLGVPDIGESCCVGLEIKSIDPRVTLARAKEEHVGQVQTQMGLLRSIDIIVDYVVIAYVDASFLNTVTEFVVKYNPATYQVARDRALEIMRADNPLALKPEGKMAGGDECKYCAWAGQCQGAIVKSIPEYTTRVDDATDAELIQHVRAFDRAREAEEAASFAKEEAKEEIRRVLARAGTRKVVGDKYSVSWFPVKGRTTFDRKAAEAAGLYLIPFDKSGEAGERLTITLKS